MQIPTITIGKILTVCRTKAKTTLIETTLGKTLNSLQKRYFFIVSQSPLRQINIKQKSLKMLLLADICLRFFIPKGEKKMCLLFLVLAKECVQLKKICGPQTPTYKKEMIYKQ